MNDGTFMTAHELATVIRQRRVSAVEVLEAYLAQITWHNPTLNALVTLDEGRARRRAEAADTALARGGLWGVLHGVPITWKTPMPRQICAPPGAAIRH
jgi:amidase